MCLCAWTCMCENLHHPSAYVGHEDCLNSPLHNKRAWRSAECLKTLVSLMDGVCVPVCLNLYVWKSASPLRLCWTWGLSELTSPQQKGLGIGRMPQNASLIDGWCCVPVCLNLYVWKSAASPLRLCWTWGLFELTSPQQKGLGIGRMPQNASLIDGWCVCACVLELVCVKICITPPLMLDMRIVWTHLSTTKGLGDRQNASKR